MGWQDQGRQQHGWFGDGRAPEKAGEAGGGASVPDGLALRIHAVVHGAIATLPPGLRRRAEARLDGEGVSRLSEAVAAWARGAKLGHAEWARAFLGRESSDPVAGLLRDAAVGAASATSPDELRRASEALGGAMQAVGLDHWPGVVADAQARASAPAQSNGYSVTRPGDLDPVPLVDDTGQSVVNAEGKPIMRPAGLDPHFFAAQGLADKEAEETMASAGSEGGSIGAFSYQIAKLARFQRGHSWDAQRLSGSFNVVFRDYATVIIGLYAASNGIPIERMLSIENIIALKSVFSKGTEYDEIYKNLPRTNVKNTEIGYDLYLSGRIGLAPKN